MRIATWNVNGLRARIEFVQLWLKQRDPDLVGIQELKLTDDQFPYDAFEALGYQALVHGQKSWNGVAILSKKPVELVQQGLPGEEDFGARLITGRVEGLTFTTVYCPNGKRVEHDDYPRKLAWFDSLTAHLTAHHSLEEPAVICGDFNIVPEALDGWNEQRNEGDIFHTDAERARMRALLEGGWGDLYRDLHPDEKAFSWWDYRGGAFHRGMGLRIDFLLGTKPLRERVKHVEIDREFRKKQDGLTASDHAPVFADLG